MEQAIIATLEAAAGAVQELRIRVLAQLEDHVGEAGVEAQHVAALDLHLISIEDTHQLVISDRMALAAEVVMQVDQNTASLCAVLREMLDTERLRLRSFVARPRFSTGLLGRGHDVFARTVAVVEHDLGLAIAVRVIAAADVRKGVPLRRVLQRHQHDVVAHHVGQIGIVGCERIAEVLRSLVLARVPQGGRKPRRIAPWIKRGAARVIERQRQAEAQTLLHFGDALQHFLARHQVHAAALIVRSELAPIRSCRPLLPTLSHNGSRKGGQINISGQPAE